MCQSNSRRQDRSGSAHTICHLSLTYNLCITDLTLGESHCVSGFDCLRCYRNMRGMEAMQTMGLIDAKEDRVQMSAVLTLSNLGGPFPGMQSFNAIDLTYLQKTLEIELMRKAMPFGSSGSGSEWQWIINGIVSLSLFITYHGSGSGSG